MEEIRSKVNEVYGTDNVKNEENITKYYDIVDVEQEFGLLQNSDFIRKQVSFVDNKLYLAGDSVNVKLSKKGSIYFIIKNQIARGLVRNILLEKLVEYKYVLDKEPVCELPQYNVYIASNDKYKLLVWINKHTNLYTLVYDYEAGLKILHDQQVKINYRKLSQSPSIGSWFVNDDTPARMLRGYSLNPLQSGHGL